MRRERVIPQTREPRLELSLVRNIPQSTDASRKTTVRDTNGEPMVQFEGKSNPFIDYHRNDLLHSLQHMRSDAHDEMTFILMTQIKELIFKATHYELANFQTRIQNDDVIGALALTSRIRRIQELLVKVWDVLSTITTHGFNEFRDHLGTSSGQQSYMYRHVEFILGNKSRRLAAAHANNPDVYPAIEKALNSPSLYDDVIALLSRRGFDIPDRCLNRDWSEDYRIDPAVEAAWLKVHEDPSPENDLYQLSEALIEIADLFLQFRWRHFVSVQRILGLKPGTGGSAGVGWLKHVLEHRFFPELWSIRTMIGVPSYPASAG
jgi:tryptophan 2,3-dioxygenase